MTLVFERPVAGAATHCMIVGCGRYPHLREDRSADRPAPVAGALALAKMMMDRRDKLVAPLATIEMLLSDPATESGDAELGDRLPGSQAPCVGAADAAHFAASGEAWLDRVRPGDVVVFYFSGHGIADRVGGAVGLLEDIKSSRRRPWAASLAITKLILALKSLPADSAWVFFDACQEIAAEYADCLGSPSDIDLMEVTLDDLVNGACETFALAGAPIGHLAFAPKGYEPPLFTQVLLKGLSGCCVEQTKEHGWAVTGMTLQFDLIELAKMMIDKVAIKPRTIEPQSERKALLLVDEPFTPVTVRSLPEIHLKTSTAVRVMHGETVLAHSADPQFVFRTDVGFEERDLTVECDTSQGVVALVPQTFRQRPPGHNIVLVPTAAES